MPVGVKNSYVSKGHVVNKVVWPGKACEIHDDGHFRPKNVVFLSSLRTQHLF
jgi:hypothetical protein